MPESVFCHACMATTTSEAQYCNAGDRVCPACESDFIEISEAPAQPAQPASNSRAQRRATTVQGGRNQGFHRQFTTPGGHNVHLHVVTAVGGIPGPIEALLNNAAPADLAALLQNMQGVNLRPFSLPPNCRGVSAGDYGPNGGAAFDDLMLQLMEAHQPQASPTSRDALTALPRRKVRPANTPSEAFSNTPSDQPAACACGEPCSVCHDGMEEGSEVVELPCQHCYHEDCITAWLKEHNTCPVCRKELPVDQELQRQQQQERQQRFQQDVQRQPAGLQSLFGALNPFHLFGGNQGAAGGQQAAAAAPQSAATHGNASVADASLAVGLDRMPTGTMERLENVQTSLRELETRLQHQISSFGSGATMYVDRQTLENQLQLVQSQNARLRLTADNAMEALHGGANDQSPGAASQPPRPGSALSSLPGLVASDDDEDSVSIDHNTGRDDEFPASASDPSPANGHSSAQGLDWAESARLAALHAVDELPPLVTSDDESEIDSEGLPRHEADHGDDATEEDDEDPDFESDYSSVSNGEMPPLIGLPREPRFSASVAHLGSSAPLSLDEQDAVDKLSVELEASEGVVASSRLVADEAVIGDRVQVPEGQQAEPACATAPAEPSAPQDPPAQDSAERRVVQRIHCQSTPQNPAGSQPSGLALAAAPVNNPAGVIVNQRPVSHAGIDSELARTVSARPEGEILEDKYNELRSHPLTQTPSRKRSFNPSEASSSVDATSTAQDSINGEGRQAERSRDGGVQHSGGLLGPVTWAARGAGRIMGSLFRRNSNNRQ